MNVQEYFEKLETLILKDGPANCIPMQNNNDDYDAYSIQLKFIKTVINVIDELSNNMSSDETILISVKNQKTLRTCFQLITSLGFAQCLIPGLGINLNKRCTNAAIIPKLNLNSEQKYEFLVVCTDFFTRSYKIPVLKNIIITFHLSDYLAALIQLSYAPLKQPGTYENYIMTDEMYDKLFLDQKKYLSIYESLVSNCFQPILMKELLILQGVSDPLPPTFARKIISKEMSRRLLASGGLLSLIRCFIEGYGVDTGHDWKKHDLICKIVATKHGSLSENDYLDNICGQLGLLMTSNNTQYISIATKCVYSLNERYPQSDTVQNLIKDIFKVFCCDDLNSKSIMSGTILLDFKEIEHHINILHSCICTQNAMWPSKLLCSNVFVLHWICLKNTKHEELHFKVMNIITKILENCDESALGGIIEDLLLCDKSKNATRFIIDEFESGVVIKCISKALVYPKEEALASFLDLMKNCNEKVFVFKIFEMLLNTLMSLTNKRSTTDETLLHIEDEPQLLTETNQQYASVLQLLSEMATLPKIISSIKDNPKSVINFVEYYLLKNRDHSDECVTIALILLNTIIMDSNNHVKMQFNHLIPVLEKIATDKSNFNYMICEETISLLTSKGPPISDTAYFKAMSCIFDNLLPTRVHGIIELTKLIEAKDPETISKKHYVFCLFQDNLKDGDSYVYLSAINGIAALGTHCTEDVLHVLCNEFLEVSSERTDPNTKENQLKISEIRMKIGDTIVKITKKLGEMAVIHKTTLLNTILCGCRDDDPFIRTSAISNLAEIALVLNYRLGNVIYEVLFCIWSIIENDKAIECRRAAVMVIGSLLKGLGKDTLLQLKENLLPIYRILKSLYSDPNEDSVLKLHAQIALEELNDIVDEFLFPKLGIQRNVIIGDVKKNIVFK